MKDTQKKAWEDVSDYDYQVFSVFSDKKAKNPIFNYLKKKSKNFIVADLGCGSGNFIPFLSKQFKHVVATDYSEALLKRAKKENKAKNVSYMHLDLKDLSSIHNELDIAVSVNSILPSTISDIDVIMKEIYKTIKKGGEFVGILPSGDSIIHLAIAEHQIMMDKGLSEKEANKRISKQYEEKYPFNILGLNVYEPEESPQKMFFPFEIEWRLKKAGFKDIKLEKVHYSWEYCKKQGYGYCPGYESPWDWFVTAKK